MNIVRQRARPFGALLLVGLLASCGRAAPEASAPQSGAEPTSAPADESGDSLQRSKDDSEPATLAEAEALLERARADLDRLALNEPGQPAAATAGAAAPSPAPPPATAPAPERDKSRAEKSAEETEASAPPAKEVSSCQTACKAFSSLERASDAVCRLDSQDGQRCQRAKQIRQDASRRVASCGCSK